MTVWFFPVAGDPVKQMSYAGPYGANLSPDGRTVVYLYRQHEPIDVHVVTADGKDTTYGSYPPHVNLNFMGWTPDSKHFLLDLSKDGRLAVPYLCAVGDQPVETHRYRRRSTRSSGLMRSGFSSSAAILFACSAWVSPVSSWDTVHAPGMTTQSSVPYRCQPRRLSRRWKLQRIHNGLR